jgi:hypothetical protein
MSTTSTTYMIDEHIKNEFIINGVKIDVLKSFKIEVKIECIFKKSNPCRRNTNP